MRALMLVIVSAAIAGAAAASAAGLTWRGVHHTGGTPAPAPAPARAGCPQLVVPAYSDAAQWARTADSRPPPAGMILDITGIGAGTAPQSQFRDMVAQARAAGITVLGYISTVDGQRPLAADEADVRNYAAWYGVTSVFLDRVSGLRAQLGYYRALAAYVRDRDHGGQLWLNPGVYPDRGYMALGGVVMAFEGTYAQYEQAGIPGWARDYPASRFAHTIYAAPAADLASALRLARERNAGHVYVTDESGGNPYQSLPGYWPAEEAAAAASCRSGGRS